MHTPDRLDIPFAVPFVHRLRFTRDVLGADAGVLADLLEPSADEDGTSAGDNGDGGVSGPVPVKSAPRPARVQFWLDSFIADARPDIPAGIEAFFAANPSRVVQAGNVQIVPGGETVKNDIHVLERMLKVFHAADLDRRSYVVVIGGGAVLDAVGFAVAIAHRGLRLVRIPTTTLAQADSGVGVKNAVNLFAKKNWLGSFAVPWAVVNDAGLLETLPDREFACGFAEAVKVSLLKDPAGFARIHAAAGRIRARDMAAALPVIRDSARMHIDHITRGGDPFEMREARPLDFGHWSAHKLEVMTGFRVRHGEAVAIGVGLDCLYSSLVHGLPAADAGRVLDCLAGLGLPLFHPRLAAACELFAGLEEFRQHLGGRLTLTMLRAMGRPVDVHDVDEPAMREAIRRLAVEAAARGAVFVEAPAAATPEGSVTGPGGTGQAAGRGAADDSGVRVAGPVGVESLTGRRA